MLRRLLKLPSPKDLGWSPGNYLGLRKLSPYHQGKTWEDWRAHCQQHYPIRYFLAEVLPMWFKLWLVWPLERCKDWILNHTTRRYHVLDLRGIDPLMQYSHGYLDPDTVFWLAGWASLMRWHREGGNKDPRQWMTPEQQAVPDEEWARMLEVYDGLMLLVNYWTEERIKSDQRVDTLYKALKKIPPTPENEEAYQAASKAWLNANLAHEQRDEEMWQKLATMRQHLWD